MRPVNLIPPEDRRGERAPLRSGPLAYLIVGVLLLGFVCVYVLVSTGNSISEHEAEVSVLEQDLASSQTRADALQSFSTFATLESSRTQTVSDLARSRFDWERVLRELSFVIPADISLLEMSGSITGSTGTGDEASNVESVAAPNLAMKGCATDQESVAGLLSALRDIDGVTRVGLANSVSGEEGVGDAAAAAGDCAGAKPFAFELTAAFDEVQVDAETGGIAIPEDTPIPDDGSGVAETKAETKKTGDSVDSAAGEAERAVETLVPGA